MAMGSVYESGNRKVNYHGLVIGYWLDDDYFDGGRHPREIDHLPPKQSQFDTPTILDLTEEVVNEPANVA